MASYTKYEVILRLDEHGINEVWLTPHAILRPDVNGVNVTRVGDEELVRVSWLSEHEAARAMRLSVQPEIKRFELGGQPQSVPLEPGVYKFAVSAGKRTTVSSGDRASYMDADAAFQLS